MAAKKRIRRKLGDILAIRLDETTYSFAHVLKEPLIAFYDLRIAAIPTLDQVLSAPIAFCVCVTNHVVTSGIWPIIGNAPLTADLREEPLFYKKDPISGSVSIYRDSTGEEIPATKEQCEELECSAVWDLDHLVDRLRDHFAGRSNRWAESLRP